MHEKRLTTARRSRWYTAPTLVGAIVRVVLVDANTGLRTRLNAWFSRLMPGTPVELATDASSTRDAAPQGATLFVVCSPTRELSSVQPGDVVLAIGRARRRPPWVDAVLPPGFAASQLACTLTSLERLAEARIARVRTEVLQQQLDEALVQRSRRSRALLELPHAALGRTEAEFLRYGLDLMEDLTGSRIGFIHFVDHDAETIELVTWSTKTLAHFCHAAFDNHYPVAEAGIWADSFRRREAVTFNDYAPQPDSLGLPEGHAHLTRLISVPVVEGERVQMLTGVGNKPEPYTDIDIETVQLIGEGIWRIARQRRAERAHRDAAAFASLLFEHISVAVVACDREGQLTFLNQTARRWFSLPLEGPCDLTTWLQAGRLFEADGKTPVPIEGAPLARALAGNTLRDQRHVLVAAGQEPRSVIVGGGPLFDREHQIGALIVMTDVTTADRVDEVEGSLKLRIAALEAAANAIVITDREGRIEWANPAFTRLSGYTPAESFGRNPREFLRSGVHPREFYRDLWDTILAGEVWEGELTNRKKDGTLYPEALTITPVRDDGGEVKHFIAVKRDLTEERSLHARLAQSQKMESIGRLAGGVAHDFNNLLTVINGALDLVIGDLRPEDPIRPDLLDARNAGDRAGELTRQLLAFSRQQVMRPEPIDLNALVVRLERMLRRLIGEDVRLTLELDEDAGLVLGDPGQLEQVLVNLVVNARDAMPRGGSLVVKTERRAADDADDPTRAPPAAWSVLSIQDTGAGIEPHIIERIFDPFFTTKPVGQGTGLGLATCHGIVAQSGGRIRVASVLGEGTTFEVHLPIFDGPPAPRAPTRETPRAASPGARILLVDDEAGLRKVTARLLAKAGFDVVSAEGGPKALRLLDTGTAVDLIITDVVMPEMSGLELVARVRQRHPAVKVLFTSGYTADTLERHGLEQSEVHFLPKPYSLPTLAARVREVLASRPS